MARPFTPDRFTRRQAAQNAVFLAALRRTGNAREAASTLGYNRSTFTKRRAAHPAFAAKWDAALAFASAALKDPPRNAEGDRRPEAGGGGGSPQPRRTDITPTTTRTANGRLQLRRPPANRLGHAAEQAFLTALSATANVRLSAAAAGFSHSAFYARRKASPAFAREMRLALELGYEQVEAALLASILPGAHDHDEWRHNDPPPIPPMTANQALQLLHLHAKTVHLQEEPPHIKRRRGESSEAHSYRLSAMYEARQARDREAFDLAEAARNERGEPTLTNPYPAQNPVRLPALDQVTGWSKADPTKVAHDPNVALFGGWRLKGLKGVRVS
ncbi:hypothetical protein [Sphingomonas albertensis]|uniref:Uncharacterized protein n=1 Tax=Sphingomonas albertensis TaxID=2762591 RepID=A0ABR7ARG6_9SPHN|nr:hypothetical protein [Sphingomonas albertensis]MBC3943045.1 hypothetical protein [Sphingomonas albertensis]